TGNPTQMKTPATTATPVTSKCAGSTRAKPTASSDPAPMISQIADQFRRPTLNVSLPASTRVTTDTTGLIRLMGRAPAIVVSGSITTNHNSGNIAAATVPASSRSIHPDRLPRGRPASANPATESRYDTANRTLVSG